MDYLVLRLLCSFICGMILSQTGSLLQLGTRNILSSPSTLGFDGLSILWVVLLHSIFLGLGFTASPVWLLLSGIPFFILIGYWFSQNLSKRKNFDRLILLGLTFNVVVGAIFAFWQFIFIAFNLPFPVEIWFGHFRSVNLDQVLPLLAVEIILVSGLIWLRHDLQIFSLGKAFFQNFQFKEKRLFRFLFIAVALGTFVVIHSFGAFAFLGLIFPIVARKLWFKKFDLPGEFFWGSVVNGVCLMVMDALCYFFPIYGAEIPVGLIATGVGAASLILILWKTQDADLLANSKK